MFEIDAVIQPKAKWIRVRPDYGKGSAGYLIVVEILDSSSIKADVDAIDACE